MIFSSGEKYLHYFIIFHTIIDIGYSMYDCLNIGRTLSKKDSPQQ
jgi:hypothetical protein